jgi:protein-S-isoprenylcysteine O-methyltransferase Ste14
VWQLVAAGLALVAAAVVITVPLYSQVSSTSAGDQQTRSSTALSVVGPTILLTLLVPVLGAALPLAARGRAWQPLSVVSAAVLAVFVLLGLLSVGWFFIPALIVSVIAVFQPVTPTSGVGSGPP